MVTINKNNKLNFALGLLLAVATLSASFSAYSMQPSSTAVAVSVNAGNYSGYPASSTTTTVTIGGSCYTAAVAISDIIGKGIDFTTSVVGGAAMLGGSVLNVTGVTVQATGEYLGSLLRRHPIATTTLIAIPASIAGAFLLCRNRGISLRGIYSRPNLMIK